MSPIVMANAQFLYKTVSVALIVSLYRRGFTIIQITHQRKDTQTQTSIYGSSKSLSCTEIEPATLRT